MKRSCSGSTLKAVGGATGSTAAGDAPSIYISQAWAFQRMLPMDELMALHLGTRTRYHRDYQIPVTTEIVKPGVEVVVSGILQCEFPGCSASATLTGLPTNGDAQCFLTFKVRITDFSGPEEVVEYIRIDNDVQNVVENCWPQADGNPDAYYFCADSLDISQSVLRSSFLRDGEAVITAKISEDVDILDFRYQNRWMLYAEAEIRCLGGADKELQATVQVQPEVTHILAAPINAQGEGPMRSTPFVDSSNGFTEPPMILLASTAALQVSVQSAFPGQFWAFVTYRVDDGITMEDIYTGAYSSKAICEAPHRARGQLTIQDFRGDPFLVNCEFEPGIPYTLILYIDALEAPWGGGEMVKLPFTGVMPDTPTNLPLVRARAMDFLDTNPLAAKVYGTLTITSAASEQNLTHYHLYYGSFGRIWPEGSEPFAIIPATGAYEYSVLVNAPTRRKHLPGFLQEFLRRVHPGTSPGHPGFLHDSAPGSCHYAKLQQWQPLFGGEYSDERSWCSCRCGGGAGRCRSGRPEHPELSGAGFRSNLCSNCMHRARHPVRLDIWFQGHRPLLHGSQQGLHGDCSCGHSL